PAAVSIIAARPAGLVPIAIRPAALAGTVTDAAVAPSGALRVSSAAALVVMMTGTAAGIGAGVHRPSECTHSGTTGGPVEMSLPPLLVRAIALPDRSYPRVADSSSVTSTRPRGVKPRHI